MIQIDYIHTRLVFRILQSMYGRFHQDLNFIRKSCCINFYRYEVYCNKYGSHDLDKFLPTSFRLICGTIVPLRSQWTLNLKILSTSATRTKSLSYRLPITLLPESFLNPHIYLKFARKKVCGCHKIPIMCSKYYICGAGDDCQNLIDQLSFSWHIFCILCSLLFEKVYSESFVKTCEKFRSF